MKPSRFTEEQIIGILREQEGHVACTLRSVHHGHPRQYTGLYTTVCNHGSRAGSRKNRSSGFCASRKDTWPVHYGLYTTDTHDSTRACTPRSVITACTHGLYTRLVYTRPCTGVTDCQVRVLWFGETALSTRSSWCVRRSRQC